jgi:hypothetical protein
MADDDNAQESPNSRGRTRAADRPMTRRGCLAGLAIWLLIITVPFAILLFAIRGEVTWHRGPIVEDRLWLVSLNGAPGEESAAGVAYSATRLTASPTAVDGRVCARTHVVFLLWRGHSKPADYCECYQPRPAPQGGYESLGNCP